jgi:predicted AAA+ superfamily ATPase
MYNIHIMIKRAINIEKLLHKGKTLVIIGPRRVGKTTLVEEFLKTTNKSFVKYDGTLLEVKNIFSVNSLSVIEPYIKGYEIIFIDEAQDVPNIGISLKIINDHFPEITVIVTGSSSFELNNQIGEPLVGRKTTSFLFPLSVKEVIGSDNAEPEILKWNKIKDTALVYGMYPNSILANNNEERLIFLRGLVKDLLLKDILAYQEVKGSQVLMNLLVLLAYQIGKEVSLDELSRKLEIHKNTVARYIDLLEKSYIIFRLTGFSRNLRSEITSKPKIYFYDVGIRNALINNFNQIAFRDDIGELWENFVLSERMKTREYSNIFANQYFWRTYQKKEIDLIEERDGKLFAFEIKWNSEQAKKVKIPESWQAEYGEKSEFKIISSDNFLDFV